MATLHLMVGLPCSGKTTKAKQLEKEYNALLLTPDAWHLKLFGQDAGSKYHDKFHSTIESIMWDHASRVLQLGVDVILDFGFWAKEERDNFRRRAKKLGVNFKIHYMDVPIKELYKRLEKRNKKTEGSFIIPKEYMDIYVGIFQPPTPEELVESNIAKSAKMDI
jgi:predicted kinase